jgi:hypothetical protein
MPTTRSWKENECALKNLDATIAKMPEGSIEAKSYVNNILK